MTEVLVNGSRFALITARGRKWLHVIERTSKKLTVKRRTQQQLDTAGWQLTTEYPTDRVVESFLKHAAGLTETAQKALTAGQEGVDVTAPTQARALARSELTREAEHQLQKLEDTIKELISRCRADGEDDESSEDKDHEIARLGAEVSDREDDLAAAQQEIESLKAELVELKDTVALLS